MNKVSKNSGLTLVEILIVVGIAGVILGISVGIFMTLSQEDSLDSESQRLVSSLRLAHSKTLASENEAPHGIAFNTSSDKYWLFNDTPSTTSTVTHLDDSVTIKELDLTNSTTTVKFKRVTGEPLAIGYIQLQSVQNTSETRTVCISKTGSTRLLKNNAEPSVCNSPSLKYTNHNIDDDITDFPDTEGFGDPAQHFKTATSQPATISSAKLLLRYNDEGDADEFNDIYLEIREPDGSGRPLGAVLGKSNSVKGDNIPNSSLGWVDFYFPASVALDAGAEYFLRLRSLPDSVDTNSDGERVIIWANNDEACSGDTNYGNCNLNAWRYAEPGSAQELSGRDFVFKLFSGENPPVRDDRHTEINLEDGLNANYTEMTLSFDGGATEKTITIADFVDSGTFEWEEDVSVSDGNDGKERVRIHTIFMDSNDTIIHIHRPGHMDGVENDVSLDIDIDTTNLITYDGAGEITAGPGTANGYYVGR